MNLRSTTQTKQPLSFTPVPTGLLQRKCTSCGQHQIAGGECANCQPKSGLQRKLSIGASNDLLEREADQVADRVLAAPANTTISTAPPHIQRFTGQTTGQADVAPDSVDRVLASPGRPLETSLQQDMGQRFGHDFSRVRVHTGDEAARSAQDVNASAYTVGHNIVFGAGQFTPSINSGRKLLAHELTHVVQQSSRDTHPLIQRFHTPHGTDPKHQTDETPKIAPTFNDLLNTIKAIAKDSTISGGLLSDTTNMDSFVQKAGGRPASAAMDEKLGTHSTKDVFSMLNYRYLFTCRCGLIDLRHFIQLMYVSNYISSSAPGIDGNKSATRRGRDHELTSESESRFGPEDTPSNAIGAFTGSRLTGVPRPDDLVKEIEMILRRCDPTDFVSLSPSSQNTITKHYGELIPDPSAKSPGDLIPAHQNQTARPDILGIAECGGKERSFPFKLDTDDSDRKTISDTNFANGSASLTSDSDIRDFVSTQRPEIIKNLTTIEKVRMVKLLFEGYVVDEDINAIETIYKNSTDAEKIQIRSSIDVSDLFSLGQRTRLKIIFSS